MNSLSALELAGWLREGRPCRLIDVREPEEWALARLEGAELLPLSTLSDWLPRLLEAPGNLPLVVYCHHGIRSARVCSMLLQHGVEQVWNLSGGVDSWSLDVDTSIPRY